MKTILKTIFQTISETISLIILMEKTATIMLSMAVTFAWLIIFTTGFMKFFMVILTICFCIGLYIAMAETKEIDENGKPIKKKKYTITEKHLNNFEQWLNN